MIEKKTVVERIELLHTGHVQIRFALLVTENERVISHSWHRTTLEPGADVDAMISTINADITTRPELMAAPIEPDETPYSALSVAKIKQACATIHTPEMVARYEADQQARRDALIPKPAPSLFSRIVSALTP